MQDSHPLFKKTYSIFVAFLASALFIPTKAYTLGMELEIGGSLGKEAFKSTSNVDVSNNENASAIEDLNNPLVYGFRLDPRLLFLHTRDLSLSAGMGLGLEFGSSSASYNEYQFDYSSTRVRLEPNARYMYFPNRSFGIGLGLGYYIGIKGNYEVKTTTGGNLVTFRDNVKEDNGIRLRLNAAMILPNKSKAQIIASYQLTSFGSLRHEKDSEKTAVSGHAFLVSYLHPILFENSSYGDEEDNPDKTKYDRERTRSSRESSKERRKRKQR